MKGHEFLFDDGHKGKGYDTEEKCWRHLDFFRHRCYLYARVLRVVRSVSLIKAHWFGIVNYFESKLTDGMLEGINSKIQPAKKRARGFRNIYNYMNMILFLCGKLKFDYPRHSL